MTRSPAGTILTHPSTERKNTMRKSTLLGGIARIVREPSREEMRNAMLRRLGAGHILEADAVLGGREEKVV